NWVLVPFQAACDHAQSQPGLVPMVLGVICKKKSRSTRPNAVWTSPVFCEKDTEPYEIMLNCRYIISVNPDRMEIKKDNFEVWGRIREPLMVDLGFHIHTYGL